MSEDRKTYVISLLETYHVRAQQIALLHYELKHPVHVSPDEMIGAMNLARGESSGGHATGHISDKTLYIALNYREKADALNADILSNTATRLADLEWEQNRLIYYVSLLNKRQADVIRLLYFEGYSQEEAAKEIGVVPRTTRRIKNEALDKLTEMYAYAVDCP